MNNQMGAALTTAFNELEISAIHLTAAPVSAATVNAISIEKLEPTSTLGQLKRHLHAWISRFLLLAQPLLFGFVFLAPTNTPMINICPQFGVPVAGMGYDTTTWTDYNLDAQAIQAVLNINSDRSFWVGYENGGFAWTNDVMPELTLTFTMADGSERWFDVFWSEQTPDAYYALPFANPTPYADNNGEHYGTHPCAAILMTAPEYQALLSAISA